MNRFSFWKTELYNKRYDQGCNKHLEFLFFKEKVSILFIGSFSITNHRNNLLKWLSYSKTSILDTTLKLKYPKINYYLHKNKINHCENSSYSI